MSERLPGHLPAHVLARPDFIAACAARDLGAIFRIAKKWAGFTHSHLCRRCEMGISQIADYVEGRRQAQSVNVFERTADGLHIPGSMLGMMPRPWEGTGSSAESAQQSAPGRDYDTEARLVSAAEKDRLDRPVLDYLARALSEHRRMEDQLGSFVMLPLVSTQYGILTRLTRYAPHYLHDEALSLAAQYSQFMAWMHHDQQDDDKASQAYTRAESQAQEAGDPTMAACVLSMKAHLEWGSENPLSCVRYAQAAQWAGQRITPAALGMAAQMEARGLALMKDVTAADRKTNQATEQLMRAADHWEDEPPWLYFYEGPWVTLQTGSTQLDLGRPARAIELLTDALAELSPAYVRDSAWYRAVLARSYFEAADMEQAAATALDTLPDAKITNRFAVEHLGVTAAKLVRNSPSISEVQELSEALTGS